ncbi:hypothetical protein [Streptomyces sp. UG1]|uniref:hypothetical protein n=1 Tax=Streptomyces sp. UG1 TaxID=3417652 RepID=UPI003CEAB4CA
MSNIVVVYVLDKPVVATRPSQGAMGGEERHVRKVHAAPTAPGEPAATGPRTLCGKETLVMETGPRITERPGAPWYPARYTSVVCPDCDAVIET